MQFTDQLNSTILLDAIPKRIVSLVPSQTEFLFDIGLDEEVVGITKFCIHPAHWLTSKSIIGGTKNIHIDKVKALNPDLIIGNKEENTKEDIEALRKVAPVWMSDICNLDDSLSMMLTLGDIVGKYQQSNHLVNDIKNQFNLFKPKKTNLSILYLIWRKPFIGVATNTFIDDMLKRCGFTNVLENESRYPILEDIGSLNPHVVLLSTEPYPFKQTHLKEVKSIFPHARIKLVDGELFSWYGSRLQKSVVFFEKLLDEIVYEK